MRCGLFPCHANISHVKKSNKLCRWCKKYDNIEDEKHILSECNLSQILNIYKGKKHEYY